MKIKITLSKSKKDLDNIVSFMEDLPNTRLITKEIHEIETPNNSVENMAVWLSDDRKTEYAKKLEEVLPEYVYEVEEISIS